MTWWEGGSWTVGQRVEFLGAWRTGVLGPRDWLEVLSERVTDRDEAALGTLARAMDDLPGMDNGKPVLFAALVSEAWANHSFLLSPRAVVALAEALITIVAGRDPMCLLEGATGVTRLDLGTSGSGGLPALENSWVIPDLHKAGHRLLRLLGQAGLEKNHCLALSVAGAELAGVTEAAFPTSGAVTVAGMLVGDREGVPIEVHLSRVEVDDRLAGAWAPTPAQGLVQVDASFAAAIAAAQIATKVAVATRPGTALSWELHHRERREEADPRLRGLVYHALEGPSLGAALAAAAHLLAEDDQASPELVLTGGVDQEGRLVALGNHARYPAKLGALPPHERLLYPTDDTKIVNRAAGRLDPRPRFTPIGSVVEAAKLLAVPRAALLGWAERRIEELEALPSYLLAALSNPNTGKLPEELLTALSVPGGDSPRMSRLFVEPLFAEDRIDHQEGEPPGKGTPGKGTPGKGTPGPFPANWSRSGEVLIVVGEGGTGKSTLARHIAAQGLSKLCEGLEGGAGAPLVLFTSCDALAGHLEGGAWGSNTLLDALVEELATQAIPPLVDEDQARQDERKRLRAWGRARIEARDAVVVLDSLEQVQDGSLDRRGHLVGALSSFVKNYGCGLLLTTRSTALPASLPGARRLYLAAFDRRQSNELIGRLLPRDVPARLSSRLGEGGLGALSSVPLLTTFLALLVSGKEPLPETRSQLYHGLLALLLDRGWQEQKHNTTELAGYLVKLVDVLGALAAGSPERDSVSWNDFNRECVTQRVEPKDLCDLLIASGIVRSEGDPLQGEPVTLRLFHPSVAEHLAGEYLATHDWREALEERSFSGVMAPVWPHVAGALALEHLEQVPELLSRLLAKQEDHPALFWHQRLAATCLGEVPTRVALDDQLVAKIVEPLVGLLGSKHWSDEAARALGAAGTRAVDALLRALGDEDPHLRSAAGDALGGICSSDPAAALRLLAWIEEHKDAAKWGLPIALLPGCSLLLTRQGQPEEEVLSRLDNLTARLAPRL